MNLITRNLRRQAAQQISDSISSGDEIYYVVLGKHDPFADDNSPPQPNDTHQENVVDLYQNMIVGKLVSLSDVRLMVPRYNWTSNTVYNTYSQDDALLYERPFYVLVTQGVNHSVFKCISNNNDGPSSVPPDVYSTSPEDTVYETADGYQWKYMYSIPDSVFKKFATEDFIPIVPNANVAANAISGSINYVQVLDGGSNYNSYGSGIIQISAVNGDARVFQVEASKSANTDFFRNCAFKITSGVGAGQQRLVSEYVVSGSLRNIIIDTPFDVLPDVFSTYEISPAVVIVGDGTGFVGRGLINAESSNSIYKVEITEPGQNFTYTTTTISANTGSPISTASVKPIISPQGGHGADVSAELGARHLCISVTFDGLETGAPTKLEDTNDYRFVGLLANPLFANVVLTISNSNQAFQDEEIVTQPNTGAYGVVFDIGDNTISLSNAYGFFETGNSSVNLISSSGGATAQVTAISQPTTYIDQTFKLVIDNPAGNFQQDERLVQGSNANGIMYFANTTIIKMTNKKGTFNTSDDVVGLVETVSGDSSGSTAKITDVIAGDVVPYTGRLMYAETIRPIQRYQNQSETLKLIIQF
jgi:hypothetical protein